MGKFFECRRFACSAAALRMEDMVASPNRRAMARGRGTGAALGMSSARDERANDGSPGGELVEEVVGEAVNLVVGEALGAEVAAGGSVSLAEEGQEVAHDLGGGAIEGVEVIGAGIGGDASGGEETRDY